MFRSLAIKIKLKSIGHFSANYTSFEQIKLAMPFEKIGKISLLNDERYAILNLNARFFEALGRHIIITFLDK